MKSAAGSWGCPGASFYEGMAGAGWRVREGAAFDLEELPREIELQAHWFSGGFGRAFATRCGRAVELVDFGVWNHEAGPDFRDATVLFEGRERVRGAIELDLDSRDWERHGHATNPAYDSVVLHLYARESGRESFARTSENRLVRQVLLPAPIGGWIGGGRPPDAFPGRCHGALVRLGPSGVARVLESAALHRLAVKAARISRIAGAHGWDEALYQSVATALGYRANKLPFALLAQRLPLGRLRAAPQDAEALLFGHAGFLERLDHRALGGGALGYVRALWERWWRLRSGCEGLILPGRLWRMGGSRPANHPQRRLAALAGVAAHWPAIRDAGERCDPRSLRAVLGGLEHPFWDRHCSLLAPAAAPMALVGATRIDEIIANVFAPLALEREPSRWAEFRSMPCGLSNRAVETALARLLGCPADVAGRFPATLWHQQGLLQIFEDFCGRDLSGCARCPFPERVAGGG